MHLRAGIPSRAAQLRRTALVVLAAAALAAAACGHGDRPNVLLLVLDTTRADRCSFTGYARPTTPRIDEFAKDAVVFGETWSPANWTGPAHASLFTGLGPDRHGFHADARPHLGLKPATLAERFSAAGYATACFTNNELVSPEFGLTRGFGEVFPLYRADNRKYPWAAATHEAAADWAKAMHDAGRPFLLFINDMEPHQPYDPPEQVARKFVRGSPSESEMRAARAFSNREALACILGVTRLSDERTALLSDLYDAEIATLDREVGVLLDRLRADGLLDSMLVVIVSDHGESIGERGWFDHSHGLYRHLLHVPLLIRSPGRFDGGRQVHDLVRLEDVAPTMLEICGLPPIDGADGVSLLRDLPGRVARADQAPNGLFATRTRNELPGVDPAPVAVGIRSVFDGAYHLIAYSDGRRELFDTVADPGETHDLSAAKPGEVSRLSALLRTPD
jgi:arylsulfatase A-like enzyme